MADRPDQGASADETATWIREAFGERPADGIETGLINGTGIDCTVRRGIG